MLLAHWSSTIDHQTAQQDFVKHSVYSRGLD